MCITTREVATEQMETECGYPPPKTQDVSENVSLSIPTKA